MSKVRVRSARRSSSRSSEVVSGYVDFPHFGEVQRTQEKLLMACVDDIHKYAEAPDIPKIEQCYRAVPRILAKENRKFKYAEVDKMGSARKYLASVPSVLPQQGRRTP